MLTQTTLVFNASQDAQSVIQPQTVLLVSLWPLPIMTDPVHAPRRHTSPSQPTESDIAPPAVLIVSLALMSTPAPLA